MKRYKAVGNLFSMVLATLLFGNAVGGGVCVAFCLGKVCCPKSVHAAASKAPSCERACCLKYQKPSAKNRLSIVQNEPSCCAWISKKADPPVAFGKALLESPLIPAVLPTTSAVELNLGVEGKAILSQLDVRGPPGPSICKSGPRAPPVA